MEYWKTSDIDCVLVKGETHQALSSIREKRWANWGAIRNTEGRGNTLDSGQGWRDCNTTEARRDVQLWSVREIGKDILALEFVSESTKTHQALIPLEDALCLQTGFLRDEHTFKGRKRPSALDHLSERRTFTSGPGLYY